MKIDAKQIEQLANGRHPTQEATERALVMLARKPQGLKGVVSKPPRYSASSIEAHEQCARKHYWAQIAGLEEPPSDAQAFGTRYHNHQEDYLRSGKQPPRHEPEGQLAAVAQPLLPRPMSPGLAIEEPFSIDLGDVFGDNELPVLTGTKDLVVRPIEIGAKSFALYDHKTMGSRRYLGEKTKQWLTENVQSNVYAWAEALQLRERGFRSLKVVDKRWIYALKQERAAEAVRVVQDLSDVSERFERDIVPRIKRMAQTIRETPSVLDIPRADEKVCEKYGGCKHRARCFGFGLGVQQGGSAMGLLSGKFGKDAIKAKATQGAGAAINPPAPKPYTPPAQETASIPDDADEAIAVDAAEEQEAAAPKKRGRPPKALQQVQETAEKLDKAFAPRAQKGQDLRTPGANPEHNYWLVCNARIERGFTAEIHDVDVLVGTAQANATIASGKAHFREEFGGHALLEAAFAAYMEEHALVGAVIVPPDPSTSAKDVIGLLRAHAAMVIA